MGAMNAMKESVQNLFSASPQLRGLVVREVQALAGDASQRRYFRVTVQGLPSSLILLEYGNAKGPAFKQPEIPSQEESMRLLANELLPFQIPLPKLFLHDSKSHRFVFEDCGDRSLAMLASGHRDALVEQLENDHRSDWLEHLFAEAIGIVSKLQKIPSTSSVVACRRWLEFENLRNEAQEFIDFVAIPGGANKAALEVLRGQLDALCETIRSFPKLVSHFDFHGHNILVRDDGKLTLIDFQDACLASPARDIVSLLNDRGMDETLGYSRHSRLLKRAFEGLGATSQEFTKYYNFTLLHWDLRVSGRFRKLGIEKKTDRYVQWIPGTLRRLGRTVLRAHPEIHGMEDLLQVLEKLCPEAREGISDPWPLPK